MTAAGRIVIEIEHNLGKSRVTQPLPDLRDELCQVVSPLARAVRVRSLLLITFTLGQNVDVRRDTRVLAVISEETCSRE